MDTLGVLTIGQAPRQDVAPILEKHMQMDVALLQMGALDGLTKEYIDKNLSPNEIDDGYILTSRLASGESVRMLRQKLQPLLQKRINDMEERGIKQILLLCTGVFPELSTTKAHLIEPDLVIPPAVKLMIGQKRLGVIVPLKEQMESMDDKFNRVGLDPVFAHASPYEDGSEPFRKAASQLKDKVEYILLDCMGYNEEIRDLVKKYSGIPTILSNALMAKIVSEFV
ncbi:AroM family protein [Sporolactobacillus sp. THM7-7]|nr:AroM family protein [Sporolactobacillus sp. THM7-7]